MSEIYKRGRIKALREIPGVGEALAVKIEEIIQTGNLNYYEEIKRKIRKGI